MGSGTRLKLLEAMALGSAIVSTRLGAEGLTGEPSAHHSTNKNRPGWIQARSTSGQPLILVDDNDPVAFADSVVALLRDPIRRNRMGTAARAFVEANYDWRVIIPRLEKLYAAGHQS
jgi:glycosyltransferase involved in cell wall biosynthesis